MVRSLGNLMKDIVVFLNGTRGLAVVKAITNAGHRIPVVVTPDSLQNTQIADTLLTLQLRHLPLSDVNSLDALRQLSELSPSLFLIAGFSTIFKQPLLELPTLGTLNLHAGKLPQYRGGSPLNWQLINGEAEAGISVIKVDAGIDTGPVMAEAMIKIGPNTTIADLHEQANAIFPQLVLRALDGIESQYPGRLQSEDHAQYWHQRNDADGRLCFADLTAHEVDRAIRALTHPYPGAWSIYRDSRVRIFSSQVPELVLKGAPGRICYIQRQGPYILCADKAILLTDYKIEPNGEQKLRHGEYLR